VRSYINKVQVIKEQKEYERKFTESDKPLYVRLFFMNLCNKGMIDFTDLISYLNKRSEGCYNAFGSRSP